MPQGNVELVKRAIRAWNERDAETASTLFHPDFEYHGLASRPERPRMYRGLEEAERSAARMDNDLDQFQTEPRELIDAGDRVVVVFEVSAIGKQSRLPVRFTDSAVFTIRDGRIARVEICGTRESALKAAGRRPSGRSDSN